jgi:hypothetical protein
LVPRERPVPISKGEASAGLLEEEKTKLVLQVQIKI